jgi:ketosteroid isomerase-like protein
MLQEYVERVRRGFERFAETGEAGGTGLHPDVEVFDHDIPDARNPYSGAGGFDEWLSDFGAAWARWDMEIEQLDRAGDRVVSLLRLRAVGAGSGAVVERSDGIVWTFRDDKLFRVDYFNDQDEALEAVGLRE